PSLRAPRRTKDQNPVLFQAVANALQAAIEAANADKRQAAPWKEVQKAPESLDDLLAGLNDPGFEFTARPQKISHFAQFLTRIGAVKTKVADWRQLFWETAHHQSR